MLGRARSGPSLQRCVGLRCLGGQSAVLNMQLDGKPETLQHLILDAAGLDDLISNLSKVRSALPEMVTPTLDPGARLDVQTDPAWLVPALIAAHPAPSSRFVTGLGWLGFNLPKDGAKALSHALASVANKQPSYRYTGRAPTVVLSALALATIMKSPPPLDGTGSGDDPACDDRR